MKIIFGNGHKNSEDLIGEWHFLIIFIKWFIGIKH